MRRVSSSRSQRLRERQREILVIDDDDGSNSLETLIIDSVPSPSPKTNKLESYGGSFHGGAPAPPFTAAASRSEAPASSAMPFPSSSSHRPMSQRGARDSLNASRESTSRLSSRSSSNSLHKDAMVAASSFTRRSRGSLSTSPVRDHLIEESLEEHDGERPKDRDAMQMRSAPLAAGRGEAQHEPSPNASVSKSPWQSLLMEESDGGLRAATAPPKDTSDAQRRRNIPPWLAGDESSQLGNRAALKSAEGSGLSDFNSVLRRRAQSPVANLQVACMLLMHAFVCASRKDVNMGT
jgi:hypothetical protein